MVILTIPHPNGKINKETLGGSVVKNPPGNAGDMGSIPGLERSPGVGNGNPLHYSHLENSMDRGVWRKGLKF